MKRTYSFQNTLASFILLICSTIYNCYMLEQNTFILSVTLALALFSYIAQNCIAQESHQGWQ